MQIMAWVSLAASVAATVGGFLWRRWRLTALAVLAALLLVPLLWGGDAAVFGLNGLGLGFGAMLLRRFTFWCIRRTLRR